MADPLPVVKQKPPQPWKWGARETIWAALMVWFVVAWFIGSSRASIGLDPFLQRAFPAGSSFEKVSDETFRTTGPDGQLLGYATTGTASGYGGPLTVAVAVNPEGAAESLAVIEHRETPSFFDKAIRGKILNRLAGKTNQDQIILGEDIDGVSGATYTCLGLTQSVHRAVRSVAQGQLNLPVPEDQRRIVFGFPEILLIVLFAVAVAQRRLKPERRIRNVARWGTRLAGLAVLGFVYNGPFVLAHINMVLIGYWPEWQTHLYWYILVIGILAFKAGEEWNVYCADFCPFGAAQDVLATIGGAKSRPVRWPKVLLWLQRILVIIAISLALIYRNPGFSSFEIFGTLFNLSGSNFQFALLAIMLLMSLFIQRPWCRYLCPIHKNATEGLFDKTRQMVRSIWQKLRPQPAI